MIDLATALCAAVAGGTLSFLYLRAAAYSPAASAICATLAGGQILVALATATVTSLLLALLVGPIAVCAAAFADVQSLRNVVLLSGALAVVQTVNPLGTAMAGILVPVLIGMQDGTMVRSRRVAFLVLLLFIPVGSAVLLAYRAYAMHPGIGAQLAGNVAQFVAHRPYLEFADFRVQALARAAELAAIGFPVWITAAFVRNRPSIAIATVCAALIVAVTLAAFAGRPRPVAVVAPALALPSVLALCEWPRARRTLRWTAVVSALGVFLTWFCAELAA